LVSAVREIIAVYFGNFTKPINTFCGQNAYSVIIEAGGTYSNHWDLWGL
jgi:hypothetical protein